LAGAQSAKEKKKKIMNGISIFLLDACFWDHLDAGAIPEETPLFMGTFENRPLTEVLCLRYGISAVQAEFEIEAARREVEL
jgi:hypothetical protein